MKRTLLFIVYVLLSLSGYAQTANNWIRQMAMDGDNLWLATNAGLVKYNKLTGEHTTYTRFNNGLCSDDLISVTCRNGKVLVGSYDNGVSEFDGRVFRNYNRYNTPFFTNQSFEEVLYDSDGNLWLGGLYYIYKYDGIAWEKYTQPQALFSSWVAYSALKQSADGTIWFCSNGPNFDGSLGCITKEKEVKTVVTRCCDAYNMDIDKQGNVWFNDIYNGILCYDGNSTKLFNSKNSPLPEYGKLKTLGLAVDVDNNVWFGCNNLLYKYDGSEFTSYQLPTDARVSDLLIDGKAIWVATRGDGLFRFEDGQFERIEYTSNTQPTEEDFPEGTKWTEIRLDTLKYDSWYSKVGGEWVPNFETIEYYVKGEYVQGESDNIQTFKKVYSNGPEWTDSLTLMVMEGEQAENIYGHNGTFVSVPVRDYEGNTYVPWPGEAYQFDWSIGTGIYFTDITMSNTTGIVQYHHYYGIIDEIKEGYFGGVRPLKYVDLDGKAPECGIYDNPQLIDTNGGRIIEGIGITEWNDGECLLGPPNPYGALRMFDYDGNLYPERHYRSMLVHFERNGEVLYDVWPKPDDDMAYRPFVEDGKVWKVGTIPSSPESPVQVVDYYYFDGDTIINGKTCKQMWCQRYVNPDYADYSALTQTSSLSKVGAWYEEDKKVYVCREGTQGMQMLYDFSLEANDTLMLNDYQPYYTVGPKQTGGLKGFKGVYRDIMIAQNGDYCTTWLEGVGGIDGPLRNVYPETGSDPQFLMSCTVGDEVIYLNDNYEDGATPEGMIALKKRFDFTHTTKLQPKAPIKRENSDASISSSEREVARPKVKVPKRSGEEQTVYGEYSALQLGIHLDPLDDAYQVSITNESGKVVYEKTINAGTIVGLSIDISAYAKGRYTVTVENSNELFTGEFDTETTGIEETMYNKVEAKSEIYNLQGQRLSSLQRGLNIVNGKKVYVK